MPDPKISATRLVPPAMALIMAGLLLGRSEGTAFGLTADYLSGFAFGAAAMILVAAVAKAGFVVRRRPARQDRP